MAGARGKVACRPPLPSLGSCPHRCLGRAEVLRDPPEHRRFRGDFFPSFCIHFEMFTVLLEIRVTVFLFHEHHVVILHLLNSAPNTEESLFSALISLARMVSALNKHQHSISKGTKGCALLTRPYYPLPGRQAPCRASACMASSLASPLNPS